MNQDLTSIYRSVAAIGRRLGAKQVVLYGSRARGDARERSDIDLAVFGAPEDSFYLFRAELDELPTLLEFDLVYVREDTDPKLLENIRKDGVTIMDKFTEKGSKLLQAVDRLEQALADYEEYHLDSVRDGVIQRFEFCTELAWKTVREYLIDQGFTEGINSPKGVMRQAYACGLLNDEAAWLELLESRNMTSHIYDEATARRVFTLIQQRFCPLFHELTEALELK
ncbi:MAG: HI0074 family nucleotidyltransferase substrate-binding subunit [Clostridiales bacterium]|nr:HI0074 family nucleotidyltransferase substrate-binding subunit [Clostridiales bacterium]